jgi:hypothetical protein
MVKVIALLGIGLLVELKPPYVHQHSLLYYGKNQCWTDIVLFLFVNFGFLYVFKNWVES